MKRLLEASIDHFKGYLTSYPSAVNVEKLRLPQHYGGLTVVKMPNRPCMTSKSSLKLLNEGIQASLNAPEGLGDTTVNICGGDQLETRGAKYGQAPPANVLEGLKNSLQPIMHQHMPGRGL